METFNGALRDECMNEKVFASPDWAQAVIERLRLDFKHVRQHSAHGRVAPEAVLLNPAAGRLRNLRGYAARLPPPRLQLNYQITGLPQ